MIEGFPDGDPLALAGATIFVPTQRAARELTLALTREAKGSALILPRIAPLGAIEASEDERLIGDADEADSLDTPPAVGDLTRRMALARMARAWSQALESAIVSIGADGRPVYFAKEAPLVASGLGPAFALAGDLAALIDDMTIEGIDWRRLERLAPEAFDPYWRITLDFLKLAATNWPLWLEEQGLIDRAARGALLVEAEIARLARDGGRHPLIIAGSTGAHRATARLIGAIAHAPRGAVVLPGLDVDLDEAAWRLIGGDGGEPASGHPQAVLNRLLTSIGVTRAQVRMLGAGDASRARFLSEALRPADTTDAWRERSGALAEPNVARAFKGLAIVNAADEREEALTIAIAMREALETPGRTAALITPDIALARRVRAELARWDITVEDSAGTALSETPAGVLARLALAAAQSPGSAEMLALLSTPLARCGQRRADLDAAARALEIGVLRGLPAPANADDIDRCIATARAAAKEHSRPPQTRALLTDADWSEAAALLRELFAALQPLASASGSLKDFIAAHRATLDAIAADETGAGALLQSRGGEALALLMDEWASGPDMPCDAGDYASLFDAVLAQARAHDTGARHPRLAILGLLEARLLHFDLALLGGLDESVWPPQARTDAFLNRPMRASLGLSAPERRIGQTAHDFVAALGAPEAILTRALKRDGAPTVSSRFLLRMSAAAGDAVWREACARGDRHLARARALDRPAKIKPTSRPEPKPARALRPTRLSVTRIETLRRDPYAIYAESILKLVPLDPIRWEPDARTVGNAWHEALNAFSRDYPVGQLPDDAEARLAHHALAQFESILADPSFRLLSWPRIQRGMAFFLDFDRDIRLPGVKVYAEQNGALKIPLADGSTFTLSAKADRIDVWPGGDALLIDYKTGAPPGLTEIQVGFAPQLTLEAAMLARGAFAEAGERKADGALYLKLGGVDGGESRPVKFKGVDFVTVAEEHFAGLLTLLNQFADEATPYVPRPFPKFVSRFGAYDHLARVREWSATGGVSEEP